MPLADGTPLPWDATIPDTTVVSDPVNPIGPGYSPSSSQSTILTVDQVNAQAQAQSAGVDPIGSVQSAAKSVTAAVSGSLNEATQTFQGALNNFASGIGKALGTIGGIVLLAVALVLFIKLKRS